MAGLVREGERGGRDGGREREREGGREGGRGGGMSRKKGGGEGGREREQEERRERSGEGGRGGGGGGGGRERNVCEWKVCLSELLPLMNSSLILSLSLSPPPPPTHTHLLPQLLLAAIFFRQTSVVWVVFIAGAAAIRALEIHFGLNKKSCEYMHALIFTHNTQCTCT